MKLRDNASKDVLWSGFPQTARDWTACTSAANVSDSLIALHDGIDEIVNLLQQSLTATLTDEHKNCGKMVLLYSQISMSVMLKICIRLKRVHEGGKGARVNPAVIDEISRPYNQYSVC